MNNVSLLSQWRNTAALGHRRRLDELTRDRPAMSLEAANRQIYRLLKEGINLTEPDKYSYSFLTRC